MKSSLIVLSTVIVLLTGSVATAEAEQSSDRYHRTFEATYHGAQVLYNFRSCSDSGGAGCVTLDTGPTEDALEASVTDAHGQPVPVWVVDASQSQIESARQVYGTFCGHTTDPIWFDPGAKLELWIGGDWWPTWWVIPEVPRCFPVAATTGRVTVTLSGWSFSEAPTAPAPSNPPAPEPSPGGQPAVVERSVDLELKRHLIGVGSLTAAEASCRSRVGVMIQRRSSGSWLDVASTTTDQDGAFKARLDDRSGRYRAIVPEATSSERSCLGAISTVVRHRH